MTREEAKQILLLHRANSARAVEADVGEALRVAAGDPELTQWLRQQEEFHGLVQDQLRSIAPPAELAARILAGTRKAQTTRVSRRQVLALAASLTLLLGAAAFFLTRPPLEPQTFDNFQLRMTSFAIRSYQMDVRSADASVVRQHLASRGAPSDFPLTPGLEKMPVRGGGRLSWHNQPVAMMCFGLPSNQTAFMFVIDQSKIEGSKMPSAPHVTAGRHLSSVAWGKDGKVYFLAAADAPETLAALAPPK